MWTLFVNAIIIRCFYFNKESVLLGSGALGVSGDGAMNSDGKPKIDLKDDSGTANEPHKPKVTFSVPLSRFTAAVCF